MVKAKEVKNKEFFKPAKVDLTDAQAKKIIRQEPVKVSAKQIGTGNKVILLHPENHAKLSKAKKAGRGAVLYMSPAEVLATVESDLDGSGIFDSIYKALKSGYNFIKKNIIDTPLYQGAIKPLVKQGVNVLSGIAKTATGNSPAGNTAIDAIVGEVGNKTGAFGLKSGNKGKKYMTKKNMDLLQGSSFRIN